MANSTLWIFLAFSFLSVLATGQAIKCYVCNSYFESSCVDVGAGGSDNSSGLLRDCDSEPIFPYSPNNDTYSICRKMTISLPGLDDRRVIRTCSWIKHKSDCYFTATKDVKSTVCQCYEEGCNASSALTATLIMLLASLCITLSTTR